MVKENIFSLENSFDFGIDKFVSNFLQGSHVRTCEFSIQYLYFWSQCRARPSNFTLKQKGPVREWRKFAFLYMWFSITWFPNGLPHVPPYFSVDVFWTQNWIINPLDRFNSTQICQFFIQSRKSVSHLYGHLQTKTPHCARATLSRCWCILKK